MLRVVVCSAALAAVIWGIKSALKLSLAELGFWPYMMICVVVGLAGIFIAHRIDRADIRSQEALPPKPHDYR